MCVCVCLHSAFEITCVPDRNHPLVEAPRNPILDTSRAVRTARLCVAFVFPVSQGEKGILKTSTQTQTQAHTESHAPHTLLQMEVRSLNADEYIPHAARSGKLQHCSLPTAAQWVPPELFSPFCGFQYAYFPFLVLKGIHHYRKVCLL